MKVRNNWLFMPLLILITIISDLIIPKTSNFYQSITTTQKSIKSWSCISVFGWGFDFLILSINVNKYKLNFNHQKIRLVCFLCIWKQSFKKIIAIFLFILEIPNFCVRLFFCQPLLKKGTENIFFKSWAPWCHQFT